MNLIKSASEQTVGFVLILDYLCLVLTVVAAERKLGISAFLTPRHRLKRWHWILAIQWIHNTMLG